MTWCSCACSSSNSFIFAAVCVPDRPPLRASYKNKTRNYFEFATTKAEFCHENWKKTGLITLSALRKRLIQKENKFFCWNSRRNRFLFCVFFAFVFLSSFLRRIALKPQEMRRVLIETEKLNSTKTRKNDEVAHESASCESKIIEGIGATLFGVDASQVFILLLIH